ncbi:hypothetical protein HG536_0H04170 [Torulaspora globosa]|uniref:DUF4187 domain-containing protein n=1 Tax=Torulaspora globosa TaxID=48254 RepID=A0A7G3ZNF5_9SACH|nr:uncharacterized protein HG536_0H04170 [Torulaspora globosa]QLL35041.1 hypothetical protein HG536_0H04170 [Torulaspora globosa]
MKRTRSPQGDDGGAVDSCDSVDHHQGEEGAQEEESEKGSKRIRRSPSSIQRILKPNETEGRPAGNTDSDSVSKRVRETQNLQEKLFTWERMQRIAFELTKDIELYTPGQDPRDFNVLWRSYVRQLNQVYEKIPSSVEPYSSHDEETSLSEADDSHENVDVPIISDESVKVVPQREESSVPEVESLPEYDGEDEELDLFMETSIDERIMRLNVFLRSELYFCYYCKVQYKSEQDMFERCPGITEDDHR